MENWYLHRLEKKEGNHAKNTVAAHHVQSCREAILSNTVYLHRHSGLYVEVTYSKFKKYTQGTRRPRH